MTEIVPADEIEDIVGAPRQPFTHLGRAVSSEQIFYILHPKWCLDTQGDLRQCEYSLALACGDVDVVDEDVTLALSMDQYDWLVGIPFDQFSGRNIE